ncbi:hypothetical protein NCCP2716_27950 [Sporosarcina sp. NCCP-2716]|nr:hypothetical protein NCCP2716_27950 [Sporosarcina sp. NCCP-2716]
MPAFQGFRYTTIVDRIFCPIRGSYELDKNQLTITFSGTDIVNELFYARQELGDVCLIDGGKERLFRISSDTVIRNGNQVILYVK